MPTVVIDNISVLLKKNRLAKQMKLFIRSNGTVQLTLPWYTPYTIGKIFIQQQRSWIIDRTNKFQAEFKPSTQQKGSRQERKLARTTAEDLAARYAAIYGVRINRIAIRDQRSRWGSASAAGNLNFNWRLILLPPRIQEYLIVHEVCHLREMNHSSRFWDLVALTIPEYKACRHWLRTEGKALCL